MRKSRCYPPERKSFLLLSFRRSRWISEEMPTSSSFKRGNVNIHGGFRGSSPRAPHRAPASGPGQADRNTRGPRVHRDSEHRQKLGRNRSAGVPRQDVANATTLTRTEDNYWLDHFSRFYDRSNRRRVHDFWKFRTVICYHYAIGFLFYSFSIASHPWNW